MRFARSIAQRVIPKIIDLLGPVGGIAPWGIWNRASGSIWNGLRPFGTREAPMEPFGTLERP